MYQSINEYDFIRAFEQVRPDNFSRAGLSALYDYFEQLEEDIGNPDRIRCNSTLLRLCRV
jgi:hypothetical protein